MISKYSTVVRDVVVRDVSDCDFRSTLWGMTKEEVKYSEIIRPESESTSHVTYKDRVLELDTIVGYHFIDDSLVEAGYAFRESYTDEWLYVKQYIKIKDFLSSMYGSPTLDEDINADCCNWSEDSAEDYDSLMFLTEWLTDRSIIRMILMGDGDGCEFGILHRSKEHIRVIENTEKSLREGIN